MTVFTSSELYFITFLFIETKTVPKRENDLFGVAVTKLMDVLEQRMATSSGKFYSNNCYLS